MKPPRVYPILDTQLLQTAGCDPLAAASAMVEGGAAILQFRHKGLWDAAAVDLAETVAEVCRSAGALLVLNDRADFAALLRTGLHVGQDDLSPSDCRLIIGPDAILGFSTHNPEQLALAEREPLDYVAFGPVFTTGSKQRPDPTVGLELLRRARTLTAKPLVAIGGITRSSAPSVWDTGADSVALIADLLPAPCTPDTIRERMTQWSRLAALFSSRPA